MALNRCYASSAVVPNGTVELEYRRDRQLSYQATTRWGAHLPHVWVEHQRQRKSMLDLAGQDRFRPLTGIGGGVGNRLLRPSRLPMASTSPLWRPAHGLWCAQLYPNWYNFQNEVEEDGCVLASPDDFIAWRARAAAADASATLVDALAACSGAPKTSRDNR